MLSYGGSFTGNHSNVSCAEWKMSCKWVQVFYQCTKQRRNDLWKKADSDNHGSFHYREESVQNGIVGLLYRDDLWRFQHVPPMISV